MPTNVTITKDRLVAIVTLVKPGKNEKQISAESVHAALTNAKFAFEHSVSTIDNMLMDFRNSDAPEFNIKLFSDDYLAIADSFSVRIDKDEMTAYMDVNITKEQSKYVRLDTIHRKLKQAGVAAGSQTTNISKLINRCNKGAFSIKDYPVALGMPEIMGKDGHINLSPMFKKKIEVNRTVKKDGMKKLIALPTLVSEAAITKDMLLVANFHAEIGKEGMTVTGKKIWSEGNTKIVKSPNVSAGKNVISKKYPDREEFFSTVRGIGHFINDQIIEVEEIFDGEWKITIQKDKMKAFLSVNAPRGGKKINQADIMKEIEAMGIKVPVDRTEIFDAVRRVNDGNEEKIDDVLFAEGEEAVNGLDGQIKWNILLEMFYKPVLQPDGSADYRGGTRYPFVRIGDTAGVWFIETKGEKQGHDVFGQAIPAKDGVPSDLALNDLFDLVPTTYEGRNARFLKTKSSGLLHIKKNNVFIEPTFEADVIDYRSGNIDFDGNVIIKNEIASGFTVKCTKDIHITGNIGACTIECGGDVFVKGGMNGNGKGVIKASGNIFLKYAENASLFASEGIYLISHALISSLVSKKEIKVGIQRIKGRIIGCKVYAWSLIQTAIVGAERSSTRSTLWAGINKEASDALEENSGKIRFNNHEVTDLQKKLTEMTDRKEDHALILSAESELAEKINDLNELNAEAIALKEQVYNPEPATIEISDTVFEDTQIIIVDKETMITSSKKAVRYKLVDGKIVSDQMGRTRKSAGVRTKTGKA